MSELHAMSCEEFDDVAAELALGVLTGRERARAIGAPRSVRDLP